MLVGVAEHRSPTGLRRADFIEDTAGLTVPVGINRLAQELIDVSDWHEVVQGDGEHVHRATGRSWPIGGGTPPSAPAEIVLASPVEALHIVVGLRDARIVVAVEEPLGVASGHLLDMLDEAPEVGAPPPLWGLPPLSRQKVEQPPPDGLAVGRRILGPQDGSDAQENGEAGGDPLTCGSPLGRRAQSLLERLEVFPWTPFFCRASEEEAATFSRPW